MLSQENNYIEIKNTEKEKKLWDRPTHPVSTYKSLFDNQKFGCFETKEKDVYCIHLLNHIFAECIHSSVSEPSSNTYRFTMVHTKDFELLYVDVDFKDQKVKGCWIIFDDSNENEYITSVIHFDQEGKEKYSF